MKTELSCVLFWGTTGFSLLFFCPEKKKIQNRYFFKMFAQKNNMPCLKKNFNEKCPVGPGGGLIPWSQSFDGAEVGYIW